jgi:hypothetical protein
LFYGPLVALREAIVANMELDRAVRDRSLEVWPKYFEDIKDPDRVAEITERHRPEHDAVSADG